MNEEYCKLKNKEMEDSIKIDFSKLENVSVKKCYKTIWAVFLSGIFLCALVVSVIFFVDRNKIVICNNILLLYLIVALSLMLLCYIVYKVESVQVDYSIEEKKADTALRRRLAEEVIMREIKIREKAISDAKK